MTRIERLQVELAKRFPNLEVTLDRPAKEDGNWFLDVTGGPRHIGVVWRADKGFGISTPTDDDYGTGADEVYPTIRAAAERIDELIRTGQSTSSRRGFRLAELRTLCGVSQTELAERLGTSQSNVVRIERRDDILLSTVVRTLEALGITVEIRAKLPSGEVREILV